MLVDSLKQDNCVHGHGHREWSRPWLRAGLKAAQTGKNAMLYPPTENQVTKSSRYTKSGLEPGSGVEQVSDSFNRLQQVCV